MRLLSRTLFWEILTSAALGCTLFTLVLFLEKARPLFEFLVRDSGSPKLVAYLFALVLPQALPYAIPLGVLVGTLITLSRMSSDGEITAMRAAGVSGRRVAPPILAFGFLMMLVAAAASLWLTPWSIRERTRIQNQLISGQLTAEVQARVFQEQFPNSILYISDIPAGANTRWHRIFLFDVTPSSDRGNSPRLTLATDAIAVPDAAQNRIQLSLSNASTYDVSKDPSEYKVSSSPGHDMILQAKRNDEVPSKPVAEMDTLPLYNLAYGNPADRERTLEARIELHERLALPFACILLALTGIPLGVGSRRSGKSSAYVLTVALAFLYDMGLVAAIHFGREGTIPAGFAMWTPNLVFAVLGFSLLARLESPGDRDYIGRLSRLFRSAGRKPQEHLPRLLDRIQPKVWKGRFPLLPQVVDTYLLSSFLFYFALWLVSFVLMFHVFTFFELLSDIIRNHIPMNRVFTYLFFLTPRLIYRFTPVSVLTAVLVVFGVLTKNNEVTAFKACGVSMYRLTVPVLVGGFLLSGGLFAFDHYWVPEADRVQDAIRAEIKGRPAQTYLNPDRTWFYGLEDRIYNYKYFDQKAKVMLGVNVFEIDPATFRLKKHIAAERASWVPAVNAWVFQNGWSRDLKGYDTASVFDFAGGVKVFPELKETPDYFVKEALQSSQMNFLELRSYIGELQQSGFDTIQLQVQLYKKFSVPLFAFILALVSAPFAFLAGNRGGMAGIGMSFVIFVAYVSIDQFFEQLGNLSELPPQLAAWSPDVVFSLVGLYFLARMRT
ncbi:MAG TPA: LptF/LptG family permease [Bryobacteraceae bacterium]|jgi:LPS export ABC transporter permease LptF/LPS export ABC transporter permease LptG|nr:LptF/LptG family permease [Bryobacteraceae bacterium]